jgi:hypothetical protein
MTGRALLLAAGLALPIVAHATIDVPDPTRCTVPCAIALVGTNGGVPDPAGSFQIVVRGFSGSPIAGASVKIDFTPCAPDIFVCSIQPEHTLADCPTHTVRGVTDLGGVARFTIVGGANNSSGRAPSYTGPTSCSHAGTIACAQIWSDGVPLGTIGVTAYDQNLSGGVNPTDISSWLADAFSGTYYPRSDYDASATLSPPDLAKLLGVSLGAGSTSSCGAYCQ